jgi:NAD(P)H dehydrogenase (quinone)
MKLNKVSIVFFSNTDVTAKLVQSAADEFRQKKIETFVYSIQGSDIVDGRFKNIDMFKDLHESEAIIFASPTYMGGVAAQFKAFADATSDFWLEQKWAGKYAAGITCGSAPNGDQSSTLQYLATLASQHGMFWVGIDVAHNNSDPTINRLGSQLGVIAHSENGEVSAMDSNTARYLASRITKI